MWYTKQLWWPSLFELVHLVVFSDCKLMVRQQPHTTAHRQWRKKGHILGFDGHMSSELLIPFCLRSFGMRRSGKDWFWAKVQGIKAMAGIQLEAKWLPNQLKIPSFWPRYGRMEYGRILGSAKTKQCVPDDGWGKKTERMKCCFVSKKTRCTLPFLLRERGKICKDCKKKEKKKKKKIAQRTDWVVFLKSCHGAQNSSVDLRMKSWQMGSAEPGITALSDEAAPHCISASQKWQQRWWGCWQDGWQYFIYCIFFFFFPPSWARCKSKSLHVIFQRLRGETLETHVVCKIQMHLQPVRCHLK